MSLQRADQFFERARGMSDGVESRHQIFDAERLGRDSFEGSRKQRILILKHSPQIEKHPALFDTRNYWRVGGAQTGHEFIGAEARAT